MNALFQGVKKVTTNCYDIFEPFYKARSKVYLFPAFYQSVTEMAARHHFYYKIENRVLLIFKRNSIMGNGCIFLNIAPMSLDNNPQKELEYIQRCFKLGISAKLNDEDIRRYHIPSNIIVRDKGNIEYIYDANAYNNMAGSKFSKHRNALQRFKKQNASCAQGYAPGLDNLVEKWAKRKNATQTQLFKVVKSTNNPKCHINRLYLDDMLQAFSFTENISEASNIIVQRLRNYDSVINDISSVIHYYDCNHRHNEKKLHVYMNIGSALSEKGMLFSKAHLRPVALVQVWKTTPKKKLTKQEYESTKQYFI